MLYRIAYRIQRIILTAHCKSSRCSNSVGAGLINFGQAKMINSVLHRSTQQLKIVSVVILSTIRDHNVSI